VWKTQSPRFPWAVGFIFRSSLVDNARKKKIKYVKKRKKEREREREREKANV
jgi:hypothetical protein